MRTPSPWVAIARARPSSPDTITASCGHAAKHSPQRMHASSTTWTSGLGPSPATAMASVGQTRTQARQATHRSGSMAKFTTADPKRVVRCYSECQYTEQPSKLSTHDPLQIVDRHTITVPEPRELA